MVALTLDGVPVDVLADRWGVPHVDVFALHASALDGVHALSARGAPAGSVVVVEEQTAGRGREGPTWRSTPGGVWLAVLLRPDAGVPQTIAIRAGLALADALDHLCGGPLAQLKWPNDVVLDDRKVGGILCEGRWQGAMLQGLALGVGVNVANTLPPELRERAVVLRDVLPGVRRIDVLDALVPALCGLPTNGPLSDAELAAFAARDWLRGRSLRRPVPGRAAGLAPDGALYVEAGTTTTVVRDGHIELA